MFKKLDKLIIKAFIGPFVATFFIVLMVLVMQFFWLYIDDFVGKGLSAGIILEFIGYQSASLVPLALPLAVLLSSIMTFGNLGESYELVAIKSAGISLLRFMQPLFIVTLFICGIAFSFANYLIPVANLKSKTLLNDIVYAKPAFDLKEGIFYDKLPGFAIKVGKKGENDSTISDIIIYEKTSTLQDNFIIADHGIMRVSADKRFLEFNLRNGWRYQERGNSSTAQTEFIRLGFKEYTKQFDLSALQFQRTDDSVYKNNHRMLSMRQLSRAIDSIKKDNAKFTQRVKREVLYSCEFLPYLDSNWKAPKKLAVKNIQQLIPDSIKLSVRQKISGTIESMRSVNEMVSSEYKEQQRYLRLHKIEWHRKISLSLACLVLFLIGAPLGSIIRKGGLGSPLIFSIIFFMVFYFLGTTGEKFAKEGKWQPIAGMWLSTVVLVPIGIFLIEKARKDSQLFNKEVYFRLWRKGRSFLNLKRRQVAEDDGL
ncbi:LptF/LptG family permease [Chitinophagaceae bacterium LB-8]|uniref:LptF/LptG family permease n=1 Tax=Paraflavisolibacter caeni TaxID=2982496 RepID=A0A9X3BEW8_9BACT|nr:LptF/LptG family permease [Paraflavisolibacter caeni]MCU7547839.1 LptF/LptG family permease [Paraflavisolibacter caeni]